MYGYLIHHGVKGMKWGIRHYQNKDGSLTAEGRVRYSKSSSNKNIKAAFDKYQKGITEIEKRENNKYKRTVNEKSKWQKEQYQKAGFKGQKDISNKAWKEHLEGKASLENSAMKIMNKILDQSDSIFKEKFEKNLNDIHKEYAKNGERYIDSIMKNKKVSEIKLNDIYGQDGMLYYYLKDSDKYKTDYNDSGDIIVKKK